MTASPFDTPQSKRPPVYCIRCARDTIHKLRFNSDNKLANVCQRCHLTTPISEWHLRKKVEP